MPTCCRWDPGGPRDVWGRGPGSTGNIQDGAASEGVLQQVPLPHGREPLSLTHLWVSCFPPAKQRTTSCLSPRGTGILNVASSESLRRQVGCSVVLILPQVPILAIGKGSEKRGGAWRWVHGGKSPATSSTGSQAVPCLAREGVGHTRLSSRAPR